MKLQVVVALCILATANSFGCSRISNSNANIETSPTSWQTPVQDAYYRRFPSIGGGSYLEEPISCDTLLSYQGVVHVMPSSMLARIEKGEGLPDVYYRTHRVRADFCKPHGVVWLFPDSRKRFFTAARAAYDLEHLSASNIRTVESFKNKLAQSDRVALRWLVIDGRLALFLMRPSGFFASDTFMYKVENWDGAFINPNTGEVMPAPGP